MIQIKTKPSIVDNSGAISCVCIQTRTKSHPNTYGLPLTVTLKQVRSQRKLKKGKTSHAILVQSKRKRQRLDGSIIKFDQTAVSLTDSSFDPKGSLLLSLSLVEFQTPHCFKLLSIGSRYL